MATKRTPAKRSPAKPTERGVFIERAPIAKRWKKARFGIKPPPRKK